MQEHNYHITNMIIGYGDISDNFLKYGKNIVFFSDIQKYGNIPYGNIFRNQYIFQQKYGKKLWWEGEGKQGGKWG